MICKQCRYMLLNTYGEKPWAAWRCMTCNTNNTLIKIDRFILHDKITMIAAVVTTEYVDEEMTIVWK